MGLGLPRPSPRGQLGWSPRHFLLWSSPKLLILGKQGLGLPPSVSGFGVTVAVGRSVNKGCMGGCTCVSARSSSRHHTRTQAIDLGSLEGDNDAPGSCGSLILQSSSWLHVGKLRHGHKFLGPASVSCHQLTSAAQGRRHRLWPQPASGYLPRPSLILEFGAGRDNFQAYLRPSEQPTNGGRAEGWPRPQWQRLSLGTRSPC